MYDKIDDNPTFRIPNSGIIIKPYRTSRMFGRILLPVTKMTQQGKVKFIGDKTKIPVKPGDDIIFDAYKGIKLEGYNLHYLEEEDIIAKVVKDE